MVSELSVRKVTVLWTSWKNQATISGRSWPLGPTGYGDSPYQSFSTFAGNPYYIDLELLIEDGYLTKEICDSYVSGDNELCGL